MSFTFPKNAYTIVASFAVNGAMFGFSHMIFMDKVFGENSITSIAFFLAVMLQIMLMAAGFVKIDDYDWQEKPIATTLVHRIWQLLVASIVVTFTIALCSFNGIMRATVFLDEFGIGTETITFRVVATFLVTISIAVTLPFMTRSGRIWIRDYIRRPL